MDCRDESNYKVVIDKQSQMDRENNYFDYNFNSMCFNGSVARTDDRYYSS
jgi:hypothetical protein